ncbi:hypothetical protein K491DRAFT_29153 [Lophiostoma macrostomum CBS 122681]|uniref:Uncharacterized protein n=1 Tax=Lophiostoma macrostomum CBS 122681 TaxID=1314788 RepID=A0A6A6SYS9_9PLEO|nr:hypothetical protein K491DRAFT_29153 [Lophiostoma macrostomum CBS 122681]
MIEFAYVMVQAFRVRRALLYGEFALLGLTFATRTRSYTSIPFVTPRPARETLSSVKHCTSQEIGNMRTALVLIG